MRSPYLSQTDPSKKKIWFHCASYGEFEGILPLIQEYKQSGECHIICSFFSSSGFEPLHTHRLIDHCIYLPFDTKANMTQLIKWLKPDCLIVSQNEYWPNMILENLAANVPIYYVCTYVRKGHWWLNSLLSFINKPLKKVNKILVQDDHSLLLLKNAGFGNLNLVGNLRVDQVIQNTQTQVAYPLIERFSKAKKTILCGSTLHKDELLIFSAFSKINDIKLIIVPHEPKKFSKSTIPDNYTDQLVFYTSFQETDIDKSILIIDTIGDLKYLYQYCDIAYVGGGFDEGIHSVLEAAAYLKPIITGPNINKFKDAVALEQLSVLSKVDNKEEFLDTIYKNLAGLDYEKSEALSSYLQFHSGSTQRILDEIRF